MNIYDIMQAINQADIETFSALIENETDFSMLEDTKEFALNIKRNLLPEIERIEDFDIDEREKLYRISERLKIGNKMLKMLVEAGCKIPEINDDYEKYSLCGITSCYNTNHAFLFHNRNPRGALWHAASPEALKIMLEEDTDFIFVNLQDGAGMTALHHIIVDDPNCNFNFRKLEMIEILIDACAILDFQDYSLGFSPLMFAVSTDEKNEKEKAAIVRMLLLNGADPNIKTEDGKTALSIASLYPCKENIKNLLLFRANPNSLEKNGETPLMIYVEHNNDPEIIEAFIKAGADLNAQDNKGNTALIHSAMNHCKDNYYAKKSLLEHGADTSIKNYTNQSALDVFLNSDPCGVVDIDSLRLFTGKDYGEISLTPESFSQEKWRNSHYSADFISFVDKFGLSRNINSFEDVLINTNFDDFVNTIENNFYIDWDWNVKDNNGRNIFETAIELKNVELLRVCLKCSFESSMPFDYSYLLQKLLINYDVEGLKLLISAGFDFDVVDKLKKFSWHFVTNYIPEADDPENENARKFKEKLDKGTAILNILHELNNDVPNVDFDGKELSYVYVCKFQMDDAETIPVCYNENVKLRRAASPMAMAEIIDANKYLEFWKSPKRRLAINRKAIRQALTPDLFITD